MPQKPAMKAKRSSKREQNVPVSRVPPKTAVDANNASGLNPEVQDRFELELCWCIQQLETSLASGKLQDKQAQDLNKHLHSLKGNTAPLIKKRQIMRNTLGDYRKKMAEDEQKFSKTVSDVKFTNSTSASKKSIFIKKAAQYNTQNSKRETDDHKRQDVSVNTKHAIIDSNRTQTSFQFNFQTCQ
ncbi:UPF0488 protein CG14286 [Linepithema humile]|uniref:UPF0488 protein CG14286 n=1 Tax=Linepithema humile TaxID=83485 RepID=UPI0006231E8D|nr:PREDICTED: UPF0488 protein CG14286 [Linepithema humile]